MLARVWDPFGDVAARDETVIGDETVTGDKADSVVDTTICQWRVAWSAR